MAGLTSARRWQLRRIFLQKRPEYSPTEAAKVLRIPRKEVVHMIEKREIDAETRVTHRLPWLPLAEHVLGQYTVAELIEALGKEAAAVIPPLLYPSEPLHVTLPIYAVKMLEYLAEGEHVSVDEMLATILHEYAEELMQGTPRAAEEAIPGFEAALAFPDEPEPLP